MEGFNMNGNGSANGYMQVVDTVAAIAARERQFREIKGLVDRSLGTLHRYWPLVGALAVGWTYIASDEERFDAVAGIAEQVFKALPVEDLMQWIAT
jgi:hypothetical protein